MWWLIIPIAVFVIILCIVLNEAHERQVKQSARMPIDDSWLFDNVDEPYREFEFETSDETEIFKDMTDKTYTSEGLDPQFAKDMLTKLAELFTPKEYDKQTLRTEIDKALEEVKKKIEDGTDIHED